MRSGKLGSNRFQVLINLVYTKLYTLVFFKHTAQSSTENSSSYMTKHWIIFFPVFYLISSALQGVVVTTLMKKSGLLLVCYIVTTSKK